MGNHTLPYLVPHANDPSGRTAVFHGRAAEHGTGAGNHVCVSVRIDLEYFFLPLVVLSRTDLFPVTLGVYTWQRQTQQNRTIVNVVITGSLIANIPLVILFFSLQRDWQADATAGVVKG